MNQFLAAAILLFAVSSTASAADIKASTPCQAGYARYFVSYSLKDAKQGMGFGDIAVCARPDVLETVDGIQELRGAIQSQLKPLKATVVIMWFWKLKT